MSRVKFLTTLVLGLSMGYSSLSATDTRILTIPTTTIEFGDVNVSHSKTITITLGNEGNASLYISKVRLHESIQDSYSITNWVGTLSPMQTVDINITFIPNIAGLKQGLFYVDSNRTNTNSNSRLIKGTGIVDTNITITKILRMCEDDAIGCLEDEAEETFGNVQVGTSTTRTVTIYNDGNTPLTVTRMRLHEKIRDMYKIDNPWTGVIPAGGSHDVNVTYTPNDTGIQQGRIYFTTDRTSGYNRKELVGTGVDGATPCAGAINIEGMGDYGIVPYGNTNSKTFVIQNLGTNPLIISDIYLHPDLTDAFNIDGDWTNITVPGRASESVSSAYVTITYDSNKAGSDIETGAFYVVTSSCQGSNDKIIRAELDSMNDYRILNFRGIQNFASTASLPVTQTLSIMNDGTSNLNISKVYLHPKLRDDFQIVGGNTLPISIPANSSHDINVTFTPSSTNTISGLIYVKGDNTNSTDGTMVLRGTVTP